MNLKIEFLYNIFNGTSRERVYWNSISVFDVGTTRMTLINKKHFYSFEYILGRKGIV
jgi:hypothetical protein